MDDLIDAYFLITAVTTILVIIQALGLYLIAGMAGEVSLGHAAFGLCGAYAAAMLNTRLGWPPWLTVPAAGLCGAVFGLLIGLPSLRVRHDFLAIVTLGFGMVVPAFLRGSDFFGGSLGVSAVEALSVGPSRMSLRLLIVAGIAGLVGLLIWRFERSWQSLIWRAISDDETAAAACGVNVSRSRLLAFGLGAAISAIGGGLLAHHLGFVNSDTFGFNHSMMFLAIVVIGSFNRQGGVIVTAIVLTALFELLRQLDVDMDSYRMTIYGLLLVLMMHYRHRRSFAWFRWPLTR